MHTLPNGKSYIGQTMQPIKKRINKDFSGYKGCTAFYNAVKKYGADSVTTKILYTCNTLEQANLLEIDAIKYYGTLRPNGYNLKEGGQASKHSPETRARMSKSAKGKPGTRGMLGLKHTPEARRKISEANKNTDGKGRQHTPEARRKISEAGKGRKHSKETRQKLSEAKKGKKNHYFGKKLFAEHRQKMSESRKGRRHSPETKQKIKDAWKRRKARKSNNPNQHKLF